MGSNSSAESGSDETRAWALLFRRTEGATERREGVFKLDLMSYSDEARLASDQR